MHVSSCGTCSFVRERYRARAAERYAIRSSRLIANRRRLVASRHLRDSATASKPGIGSGFVIGVAIDKFLWVHDTQRRKPATRSRGARRTMAHSISTSGASMEGGCSSRRRGGQCAFSIGAAAWAVESASRSWEAGSFPCRLWLRAVFRLRHHPPGTWQGGWQSRPGTAQIDTPNGPHLNQKVPF